MYPTLYVGYIAVRIKPYLLSHLVIASVPAGPPMMKV